MLKRTLVFITCFLLSLVITGVCLMAEIREYYWVELPDGSYRQMFIDARENPDSTGNGDKGATGFIFYVIKSGSDMKAVVTGYDVDNMDNYRNAPDEMGITEDNPSKVNKMGKMIDVDYERSIREFHIDSFNISYNLNGGTVNDNPARYSPADTFVLNNPEKTGYTFTGWSGTGLTGNNNTSVTIPRNSTGNRSYTAHYAINSYKLTLDTNGSPDPSSERHVEYNSVYGDLGTPAVYNKLGNKVTFIGWYTERTGGTKVTASTRMGMADTVIYAHFTESTKQYTLTFNANGGTVAPSSKTVPFGECYGPLPVPEYTGHDFIGWHTQIENGTKISETDRMSTEGLQVYAHWNKKTFLVSFDVNGGSGTCDSKQVTFGEPYGTLPTPADRSGYDFEGWFMAATDGSQITEDSIVNLTEDTTLYAHYTKAHRYTVDLNTNGGKFTDSNGNAHIRYITVYENSTYGDFPEVERAGYSFLGWFTEEEGGRQIQTGDAVDITENIDLYAHWQANTYTVYLNANGGQFNTSTGSVTTKSQSVVYDEKYGALPVPVRSRYVFYQWTTEKNNVSYPLDYGEIVSNGQTVTENSRYHVNEEDGLPANHTLYATWIPTSAVTIHVGCMNSQKTMQSMRLYAPNGEYKDKDLSDMSNTYFTVIGYQGYKIEFSHDSALKWGVRNFAPELNYAVTSIDGACERVFFKIPSNLGGGKRFDINFTSMNSPDGDVFIEHTSLSETLANENGITKDQFYEFFNSMTASAERPLKLYAGGNGIDETLGELPDGNYSKEYTVKTGDKYNLPTPTLPGYAFDGWYLGNNNVTQRTPNDKITNSSTINQTGVTISAVAHWKNAQYLVWFQGGYKRKEDGRYESIPEITVTNGQSFGTLPEAVYVSGGQIQENYEFMGWYTSTNGGGTKITASTIACIGGDYYGMTLYPYFIEH